jgi:flagellar basal body rod protein FlgC
LDNEVINVQEASVAYRANLAVVNVTDEMQQKLLDAIA